MIHLEFSDRDKAINLEVLSITKLARHQRRLQNIRLIQLIVQTRKLELGIDPQSQRPQPVDYCRQRMMTSTDLSGLSKAITDAKKNDQTGSGDLGLNELAKDITGNKKDSELTG